MTPILVFGSGGHAGVIKDAIEVSSNQYLLGLVVESGLGDASESTVIFFESELLSTYETIEFECVIAVGEGNRRLQLAKKIRKILPDVNFAIVKHPLANQLSRSTIGPGSFVAAGATIGVRAQIGEQVLINTNASVDHDTEIEDYCSIGPNVAIGGNVVIKHGAFIGIGSTILPGIQVGSNSIVGAGAVVVNDVPANQLVLGVPARVVKK